MFASNNIIQINYDWDDIALYVYEGLLEDKKPRRYQHIIVDEGQDFSPMMLRSLIEAVSYTHLTLPTILRV